MSRHSPGGGAGVQSRRAPRTGSAPRMLSRAPLVSILGLCVCLLLLGLAGGGFFTVKTVNVVGTNLPVAQIQQAAGVSGQNIFTVRSDQVIDNVATISSVEVTKVETSFPGMVTIYARMRQPVLAWQSAHGLFLLDVTGHVIARVPTTSFPIVAGGSQPPNGDIIAGIRYAVSALPAAPNGTIAGFVMDPRTGLNIDGKTKWKAVLGSSNAQTMVGRVATLVSVLQAASTRGQSVSYVDLRYKEPFYRVSGG